MNLPLTGYRVKAEKSGHEPAVQSHVLTTTNDSLSLVFKLKARTDPLKERKQTEKGVLGGGVGGVKYFSPLFP